MTHIRKRDKEIAGVHSQCECLLGVGSVKVQQYSSGTLQQDTANQFSGKSFLVRLRIKILKASQVSDILLN